MSKTRSEFVAEEVKSLLRARNPLLWIVSKEEERVEEYTIEAAAAAGFVPRMWDIAQGVTNISGTPEPIGGPDPSQMFEAIRERAARGVERGVWIMRDLPVWSAGPPGAVPLRQLRNLARSLPGAPREGVQAIIVVSPSNDVPPELSGYTTVIEWPMPDRDEIAAILEIAIETNTSETLTREMIAPNGTIAAAIDAAVGLAGEEAKACFSKSLVQLKRIDPAAIAQEKKRVIARERVLEWYDPLPGGLDVVGGLDLLKDWLLGRKLAYSPKARAYGLPLPKGALLVGVPGCGKSLIAKAIATAFGVPLLRVDLGALKAKFVGESEANLRKALQVIAAIGRCIVWFDEIEKALQGATSGSADGGVSSDALGTILSWMQERQGEAFVIATANDVSNLPPELLRKGRFDEVWWVDLPTEQERAVIVVAAMKQYGRPMTEQIDPAAIAIATEGFTGSEIAAIIPDAMFKAFADDGREINTKDLLQAAKTVTPLSKTAAEKIDGLRKWASGRARPATSTEAPVRGTRKLSRASDI